MTAPDPTAFPSRPKLLFLPDGNALFLDIRENGILCTHTGSGDDAWLAGDFADALLAQVEGGTNDRQHTRLSQLARNLPWLRNAASATANPPSPATLLLGQELGMLFVELTARCNERCLHCYAESSPERSESLAIDEVRRLLAEARKLGNPAIQFTGGDPLIHPHLVEAVAAARELDYDCVEIYTNGLLLDAEMLERLRLYAPDFAFSFYSHDATIHDGITRLPGSHGKTLAAIRRTMEAGFHLRIGVILMPENRGHAHATLSFLEQELGLGPEQISFDTVKGTGRGAFADDEPDLDGIPTGAHTIPSEEDKEPSHADRKGKLCIASNGYVYPCIFSRGTVLGDIRKQSLGQIMDGLEKRALPPPSAERWTQCQQQMTCWDCRIIAYALGTDAGRA